MGKLGLAAITAVTTACIVMPSVASASPNPYSFVQTSDWTYTDLDNLYQSGVFKDYTDVKFDKTQKLTRSQIAVLVGKAMAAEDYATTDQKKMIEKLSTEYQKELHIIGVDEDNPNAAAATTNPAAEKKSWADKVDVSGFYRIRYQNLHMGSQPVSRTFNNRIDIGAKVQLENDWTADFHWDAYRKFAGESSSYYNGEASYLSVANLSGMLGKSGVGLTVGRFDNTFGSGLMYDDHVTGARVDFGNKLKVGLVYADTSSNSENDPAAGSHLANLTTVASADLTYDLSKATTGILSAQEWFAKDNTQDNMLVWDTNLTTKLANGYKIYGTYDKTNSSSGNYGYVFGFGHGKTDKNIPGSHAIALDYEYFGKNVGIDTTYWVNAGSKGLALTYSYVPAKNVVWTNAFFRATTLDDNDYSLAGGTLQSFVRTQMFYYF